MVKVNDWVEDCQGNVWQVVEVKDESKKALCRQEGTNVLKTFPVGELQPHRPCSYGPMK